MCCERKGADRPLSSFGRRGQSGLPSVTQWLSPPCASLPSALEWAKPKNDQVHVGVPRPGVLLSKERSRRLAFLPSRGPDDFPQSPIRGFSSILRLSRSFPGSRCFSGCHAASDSIPYSGSYTSAVTQSRCSTASFRATATTAFRFPLLPPLPAKPKPHRRKPLSGTNGPKM